MIKRLLNSKSFNTLIIFDRDDTLNVDDGYTFDLKKCQPTTFAKDFFSCAKEYDFSACITSNQSGIG